MTVELAAASLPARSAASADAYLVTSPARLHFGLLNESGTYGRIDGGLGLAIEFPCWRYTLRRGDRPAVDGALDDELRDAALALLRRVHERCGQVWAVDVHDAVAAHAGFGSKTSLLGSLAMALHTSDDGLLSAEALAAVTGRGGTSGVGINLILSGGVVVDVGRRFPEAKSSFGPSSTSKASPPTLMTALPAPALSVIHLRYEQTGPSGAQEAEIFRRACPVREQDTTELLAHTFSQLVPGLLEGDERSINQGLAALQDRGLKRHEWEAQSAMTLAFRSHVRDRLPDTALALSSMGPTMFALVSDPTPFLDAVRSFPAKPVEVSVTRPSAAGTHVQELA